MIPTVRYNLIPHGLTVTSSGGRAHQHHVRLEPGKITIFGFGGRGRYSKTFAVGDEVVCGVSPEKAVLGRITAISPDSVSVAEQELDFFTFAVYNHDFDPRFFPIP